LIYLAALGAGEIPNELIPPLAERGPLALDAQGVLRKEKNGGLVLSDWEEKLTYLPYITYLKTDAAEAEILTGFEDRDRAAEALLDMGAEEVMVTHHTEVIVGREGKIYRQPLTPKNLSGRTGRGDTCFSAYLTWRLGHDIPESLAYAAALVSEKMETPGMFGGSREDVERRIGEEERL
jgi:sugar/nucleoside kinase (ribokinase family)